MKAGLEGQSQRVERVMRQREVYLHHYQTFEEAQARLQTFLEDVDNAKHLHSSFGYVHPDEFEATYLKC
jgi:putative transposase